MTDQILTSVLCSVANLLPGDDKRSIFGTETVLKQATNRILEMIGGLSG